MKKTYLITLSILLAAFFVACSDSKNDGDPKNPINPKTTAEYAHYGAENYKDYNYVGDVSTITKTGYSANWKAGEDGQGVAEKGAIGTREEFVFDKAGLLTKYSSFVAVNNELRPFKTEEVKYDSDYRITERVFTIYDASKSSSTIESVAASRYTYDDEAKVVHKSFYSAEGSAELILKSGVLILLDENGRIDAGHFYSIVEDYEEMNSSTRAIEKHYSKESTTHSRKDKKGNIVLNYDVRKDTQLNDPNNPKVDNYIRNYYEQSIKYFDGTTSEAGELEKHIEGGLWVAETTTDHDVVGRVKSIKSFEYEGEIAWDEVREEVVLGTLRKEHLYNFDKAGVLVGYISRGQSFSSGFEKEDDVTWRYDSKLRITQVVRELYYNGALYVTYNNTVGYNDGDKIATFLAFKTEVGEEEVLQNTYVYKLADDGSMSENNVEYYREVQEPEPASMARAVRPEPYPSREWIERKDEKGNWTERFELCTNVQNNPSIRNYQKREISYN